MYDVAISVLPIRLVYAKLQITYEIVRYGDEKWGSGSPFFQKTIVMSTQLTYKNVKSIVGSKGLEPLGGVWGGAPKELCVRRGVQGTAYAKSQKTYEVVCRGDEKWGSGSPFFQKTSVISTRLIHKTVSPIVGSKGLSPLAGFGAEPQKNFAYTPRGGRKGTNRLR